MRVAIIGAHRTGKSTLARELAQALNYPYIETKVSKNFKDNDVKAAEGLTGLEGMLERFDLQWKILYSILDDVETAENGVLDRSPIDVFVYSFLYLNDILTTFEHSEHDRNCCITHCGSVSKWVGVIDKYIILQPAIPVVEVPTAASTDMQGRFNATMLESMEKLFDGVDYMIMPVETVDLKERLDVCLKWLSE